MGLRPNQPNNNTTTHHMDMHLKCTVPPAQAHDLNLTQALTNQLLKSQQANRAFAPMNKTDARAHFLRDLRETCNSTNK